MINEYENTLRRLIINIIGGEDTSSYLVSEDRIEKWKDKRETAKKKNKGILLENELLYYSDFYDLKTIITKNWELFLDILKDKKRFEIFFSEIENYRNTLAHGRNLISSQENLLKGITSDLKNSITIYHNRNEMKDDFFIQIIKVSDNLGNTWENTMSEPIPTLRIGDEYELFIDANDPKDRKVSYNLDIYQGSINVYQDSNHFTFTINKLMVGPKTTINLSVSTPGSKYKNVDFFTVFITVLPE